MKELEMIMSNNPVLYATLNVNYMSYNDIIEFLRKTKDLRFNLDHITRNFYLDGTDLYADTIEELIDLYVDEMRKKIHRIKDKIRDNNIYGIKDLNELKDWFNNIDLKIQSIHFDLKEKQEDFIKKKMSKLVKAF